MWTRLPAPGRVACLIHSGESVLVTGQAGSQPLRVRVPAGQDAAARAGRAMTVEWRAGDVHLIPRGR